MLFQLDLNSDIFVLLLIKSYKQIHKHETYPNMIIFQMPGCEGGRGGVSVALPGDFLNRLARDVVRMTEGEPHGIR